MSFNDIIKNKFIEEVTDVSVSEIFTAVLLACVLGVFIVLIYKITFTGVVFNRNFALGLVLLPMITSLVVLCISSNIVLSLGMVGALSIVRFRTAVKEVMDTVFMFWAITAGIVVGAGFTIVAIIATVVIGLLFVLISWAGNFLDKTGLSTGGGYLVVILYDYRAADEVLRGINSLPKYKIKSKSLSGRLEELVLELKMSEKDFETLRKIKGIKGVEEVNTVSHSGSTIL
ncbi:MAG: DUF4956 domain-containing protein [Ruminococcaceae bacterium]|nr:DUF4956 domain-containing protein [Oscillospiraceae bacterium]